MIAPMTTPERRLGPPWLADSAGETIRGASMPSAWAIDCFADVMSLWDANRSLDRVEMICA